MRRQAASEFNDDGGGHAGCTLIQGWRPPEERMAKPEHESTFRVDGRVGGRRALLRCVQDHGDDAGPRLPTTRSWTDRSARDIPHIADPALAINDAGRREEAR